MHTLHYFEIKHILTHNLTLVRHTSQLLGVNGRLKIELNLLRGLSIVLRHFARNILGVAI